MQMVEQSSEEYLCRRKAEGVSEGTSDGATEEATDGLHGKMGGSTGIFKEERVTTWEEA